MKKESPRQLAKILYELTKDVKSEGQLNEILTVYVKHLEKVQSLKKISFIFEEFRNYSDKLSGKEKVSVISGKKLSAKTIEQILQSFQASEVKEETIDESLLGGVVVKTSNYLFDASLKTQLQNLKNKLSTR